MNIIWDGVYEILRQLHSQMGSCSPGSPETLGVMELRWAPGVLLRTWRLHSKIQVLVSGLSSGQYLFTLNGHFSEAGKHTKTRKGFDWLDCWSDTCLLLKLFFIAARLFFLFLLRQITMTEIRVKLFKFSQKDGFLQSYLVICPACVTSNLIYANDYLSYFYNCFDWQEGWKMKQKVSRHIHQMALKLLFLSWWKLQYKIKCRGVLLLYICHKTDWITAILAQKYCTKNGT